MLTVTSEKDGTLSHDPHVAGGALVGKVERVAPRILDKRWRPHAAGIRWRRGNGLQCGGGGCRRHMRHVGKLVRQIRGLACRVSVARRMKGMARRVKGMALRMSVSIRTRGVGRRIRGMARRMSVARHMSGMALWISVSMRMREVCH